jgi:hypothetical protein
VGAWIVCCCPINFLEWKKVNTLLKKKILSGGLVARDKETGMDKRLETLKERRQMRRCNFLHPETKLT